MILVLACDKLDHVISTDNKCTEQERKDIYIIILNGMTGIPLLILISNNKVKDGHAIFKLFKEKFQSASSLDQTSIKDNIKLLYINKGQDMVVILNKFDNLYKDLIEQGEPELNNNQLAEYYKSLVKHNLDYAMEIKVIEQITH